MKGFTLIELLVSVTIVILLASISLVAFLNYLERSQAQSDALAVANRLKTVQIKATAVEVPSSCTSVTNYLVTMTNSDLTVSASCPGVGAVAIPDLSLTLTNSSFSGSSSVTFSSRDVSASPATIDICGNKYLFEITVNAGANISRPVYKSGC